tara:strand:- start:1629 stop:1865 length:237 start_codon:yes stop_codon:yes gene_type:complete
MGVIEGFTTVMVDGSTTEEQKKEQLMFLLFALIVKFLLILVVGKLLWPRVMPKLFKGVQANPSFMSLLGLSIIVNLLL